MNQKQPIILNENIYGIRMIRKDMKNRSRVDVVNKDGVTLHTYRMNNVLFYEHKYLSWQNLDHCNGWNHDEEYLNTAVQKDLKLVEGISIDIDDESEIQAKLDEVRETLDLSREDAALENVLHNGPRKWMNVVIARKGSLSDFYDMKEIVQAYLNQGIEIDENSLEDYFKVELGELFTGKYKGFDYANLKSKTECVVCGLGLGYPILSCVSVICSQTDLVFPS